MEQLTTKVTDIDIQLVHSLTARELDQGKKGGVQSICQALNCQEMTKAPPWRTDYQCKTCFRTFINVDSKKPSIPLKKGRTSRKDLHGKDRREQLLRSPLYSSSNANTTVLCRNFGPISTETRVPPRWRQRGMHTKSTSPL